MPAIGDLLNEKYRLIAKIGEGGMGVVYHAENVVTHKQVAIKWMHPHIAVRPEAVSRLLREAQAASRLSHPNLVDVYDIVQDGDTLFLVMELLQGETLRSYLAHNPQLKLSDLIALLLPALDGVATAHELGVIHRDLKPDNIFLVYGRGGAKLTAKVVDFGVAKLSAITNLTTLTETGTTMGTPVYMSLEQLSGLKDLDGRADVYSFGAIFYEAVAGQTPYTADSVPELAFKIAAADPEPVLTKRPELPAQLARVIDWAVAREREQRMPDIRTLMRELEVFADDRAFVRDPSDTDTDTSAVPRVGRTSIVPSLNAPLVDAKLQLELQALDAALAPAPRSGLVQVERKPLAEDSLVAKDLPSYYRAPRHSKWRTFALPALGLLVGSAALFAMQETPEVAETTTRAAATAAAGASALQPTAAGAIVSAANDSGVAGLPLAEAAEPVRPAADGATANAAETQRDPSASSIAALPHETMRPQAPPTGSLPAIAAPKPNAPPSAKSQQAQPDVRSQIRSRAAKLLGF